ncbi:fasciclin domain-containing protein [Breznakibacter xylanolyticus]|uniref:Fasciclin domain-containing protein n=1 Tax=Breznakibacter xylanolyticus TaxID=990 RepID=A0A2W7NFD5_9BACT|nr:fasciclin domain-containing protein [Breznakibacter xylanolyticus]PZX18630.1 fasciclin domain-containing protein [Breznakibacter xylanolyticus]
MRRKFAVFNAWMVITLSALLMVACEDKEAYYDRPSWLEPPIYQQLKERGNFTHYLACVDKAGYEKTLQGAGFYTVFAPNDAAFDLFFKENGFTSIDEITADIAKSIVTYSLTVSAVSKDSIDDYKASAAAALVKDVAFKRQTYYYKWVYEDSVYAEGRASINQTWTSLVDMNAVESELAIPGVFESTDNNRKHIPFFTDAFMAKQKLTAEDYNYFFPNTPLTDFNVADARVVDKNIWAENGIIHVVDKVLLPLDNLSEILARRESCSSFRSLLEKYTTSYSLASESYLLKYFQASGEYKQLYIKDYPYLSFAPNCENYLRYGGGSLMDAYTEGWTMFAPNNTALKLFYDEVLFTKGYKSLNEVPDFVIREFVNAHLFRKTVWPSKFAVTTNPYGEVPRFDPVADVEVGEMASNGLFYSVTKVQNTDAFRTVLGEVILNPNYSMMYQALDDLEPLVNLLKNPIATYRLFLISNDQFAAAGFKYNAASSKWEFTSDVNRPDLGSKVDEALRRFMNHHIVLTTPAMETNGLSFVNYTGMIQTYENQEYIKLSNNVVYAAGNASTARPKILREVPSTAVNGKCYELDRPILFSVGNLGNWLSFFNSNSNYRAQSLLNYLNKAAKATYVDDNGKTVTSSSAVYNVDTKVIKGIANTDVITVFLPNDPAMTKAVTAGVLTALANFAPNGDPIKIASDNTVIERFVKYHIVKGNIVVGDIVKNGTYTTYRTLEDGSNATLTVNATEGNPGAITITDNQGRTAKVITGASSTYNILGNRCIVHMIDNYLTY